MKKTDADFKPPTEDLQHALWVIRNWTKTPIGNLTTYREIVERVNRLATEVLERAEKTG